MLTEDLCVLAALKTGRPVKWEFTRSEQFTSATTRHPMKITIKLGAKKDGTLTAMQIHTVSNTGAYGNHGGEVLASSLGSCDGHVPLPQQEGHRLRGLHEYGALGRLPRIWRDTTGVRHRVAPSTSWAASWGSTHSRLRRKNMIQARDPVHSIWPFPHDGVIGSYGLDQCLDFVEQALASGRGEPKPDGDEWLEGRGVAIHAQDCAPPTEHRSEAHTVAAARRNLPPGRGVRGIRQWHQERAAAGRRHAC